MYEELSQDEWIDLCSKYNVRFAKKFVENPNFSTGMNMKDYIDAHLILGLFLFQPSFTLYRERYISGPIIPGVTITMKGADVTNGREYMDLYLATRREFVNDLAQSSIPKFSLEDMIFLQATYRHGLFKGNLQYTGTPKENASGQLYYRTQGTREGTLGTQTLTRIFNDFAVLAATLPADEVTREYLANMEESEFYLTLERTYEWLQEKNRKEVAKEFARKCLEGIKQDERMTKLYEWPQHIDIRDYSDAQQQRAQKALDKIGIDSQISHLLGPVYTVHFLQDAWQNSLDGRYSIIVSEAQGESMESERSDT